MCMHEREKEGIAERRNCKEDQGKFLLSLSLMHTHERVEENCKREKGGETKSSSKHANKRGVNG